MVLFNLFFFSDVLCYYIEEVVIIWVLGGWLKGLVIDNWVFCCLIVSFGM